MLLDRDTIYLRSISASQIVGQNLWRVDFQRAMMPGYIRVRKIIR